MSESAELEPWQQRALQKFQGRGLVQITGRQTGKTYSAAAIKRLWEDIASRPVEDLKLTVGTVYGTLYFIIEPIGGNWLDMETWCHETFGPSSTSPIWGEAKAPHPAERWYMNNRRFWFRDKKDHDWFILRWRS